MGALFLLLSIGGALNVNGLWLPLVLYSIAQNFFLQFLLVLMENRSSSSAMGVIGVLNILVIVLNYVIGLALYGKSFNRAFLYIEWISSIIPLQAGSIAFTKVIYRAKASIIGYNGLTDLEPWGYNGALREIIMLSIEIVLFPLLTFLIVKSRSMSRSIS